ncbi:hypothetical protein ACWWJF_15880 [Symbiopectobacterium sp. Eva_TO]
MTKSERETLKIIHRYLQDGYGYLSDGRVQAGVGLTEKALASIIALLYAKRGRKAHESLH